MDRDRGPRQRLAEVTLDSLHAPGNATHGFMDFMLMMGVAGENQKADHVDSLDLFHTMEAYFTWYPNGRRSEQVPPGQVPLHGRPRPRPGGALPRGPARDRRLVGARARQRGAQLPHRQGEHLAEVRDLERGPKAHDYVKLFELGAHPFLTLTLFIAMFERDNKEPLEFQKAYGAALASHFSLPYPDIAT